MLVKIGIAPELIGISPSTLRRWEKEEKYQR
jgi:DNA-binding transcriptional MerR regulator